MITLPVTRELTRPLTRAITDAGAGDLAAAIRALFANGEQGVWYDPSDLSAMYQDAAGTTPCYQPGQGQVDPPVGLMLDKRLGLSKGPELLTNGEFASDSGWTKNAGWGISGGSAVRAPAGASSTLTQNIPLAAGVAYVVEYTISSITAGSITPRLSGGVTVAGNASTAAGTYKEVLVSAAGNTRLELYANAAANATIDIVSLRALPGNHAYQSTTTCRPRLSARYNLLTNTDSLSSGWSTFNGALALEGAYWKFTENTSNSLHSFLQTPSQTKAASYRASFVGKPAGRSIVRFVLNAYSSNFCEVRFDLAAGTVAGVFTGGDGVVESYSIVPVGDGAYRCTIVGKPSAAAAGTAFDVSLGMMADGVTATYLGDGVSGILVNNFDCRSSTDGAGLPSYQKVVDANTYDTAGFPLYLKFDGVDDFLQTASVDFSATNKIFVGAGARKLADTGTGLVLELSTSAGATNPGSFALYSSPNAAAQVGAIAYMTGLGYKYAPISAPANYVQSVQFDASLPAAGQIDQRVNESAVVAVSGGDIGAGNFGNYAMYMGRRGAGGSLFAGYISQVIVCGKRLSAAEINAVEKLINSKVRAY